MILKNGLIKDITKECWITLDFLIQETWRLAKYSKFVNISKIIEYATIALILFRASPKTRDLCMYMFAMESQNIDKLSYIKKDSEHFYAHLFSMSNNIC